MQASFNLVSNIRVHPSSSGESEPRVGGEFNRGIFQIVIPAPALSGEVGSRKRMRLVMYVSVDASGSMQETATRRGQATQTKMDFVHMTLKTKTSSLRLSRVSVPAEEQISRNVLKRLLVSCRQRVSISSPTRLFTRS